MSKGKHVPLSPVRHRQGVGPRKRLIAAAPELLEAGEELEVAVSMAFGPDREDVIRKAAAKMRAAIAKAEGRV